MTTNSQNADRGGRRRDRRRVCLHVRDAGVRVTIVEKRPRLLEFADTEMVEALTYNMRDRRVTMRLNEEVESVEEIGGRTCRGNAGEQKADYG